MLKGEIYTQHKPNPINKPNPIRVTLRRADRGFHSSSMFNNSDRHGLWKNISKDDPCTSGFGKQEAPNAGHMSLQDQKILWHTGLVDKPRKMINYQHSLDDLRAQEIYYHNG